MPSIAILGASGHGKVVAEIAELNGFTTIDFFDDRFPELTTIEHWKVVGNSQELYGKAVGYDAVFVAIGNNTIRNQKQLALTKSGANLTALIHPSATVSKYANVGDGSIIMAGAVVNPFATIGKACIVNTNSTVEHDCCLADGVHLSPNVALAGTVSVGMCSWVGLGATVKQLIKIEENVIIGAGATVVNNIPANLTVIGTPAKPLS